MPQLCCMQSLIDRQASSMRASSSRPAQLAQPHLSVRDSALRCALSRASPQQHNSDCPLIKMDHRRSQHRFRGWPPQASSARSQEGSQSGVPTTAAVQVQEDTYSLESTKVSRLALLLLLVLAVNTIAEAAHGERAGSCGACHGAARAAMHPAVMRRRVTEALCVWPERRSHGARGHGVAR